MKEPTVPYAISQDDWVSAIKAIASILANCAKKNETISYGNLYNQIRHLIHSSPLTGPEDHRFHHMLGEVSTAEHRAGRGMLSVLVVHETGDMKPGRGFFMLARQLGYAINDEDAFWISEFARVCEAWR